MDLDSLSEYCKSKPGATAEHPFGPGALVMKVGGKMFAIIGENSEPLTVSLKCEPEIALTLRAAHAAVEPGYHLSKKHWNTVTLDGTIKDNLVSEWIDDSYDLVFEGLTRRARYDITQ
jgi:predicted DNA-binding protein (MmcQ/YjbR family)